MIRNKEKDMKRLMVVPLTIVMVLIAGLSFAEPDKRFLDLEILKGLPSSARNELIKKARREFEADSSPKSVIADIDPEKAEKWAKVIGGTIKTISEDLSLGVNEFVKTDVGKITMVLIVYKVIGEDIKAIVFGAGAWLLVTPILLMSFRFFHGSRKLKIKDEEGNITDIKYIPRYKWNTCDDGSSAAKIGSAAIHIVVFVAISITCLAIVV